MQGTRDKTARDKGRHPAASLRRGAGFTFIEIMFAVIILGIGFIMVAALFPVALQQTQATANDTFASGYANSLSQVLSSTISSADVPPTGESQGAGYAYPPIFVSFGNVQSYVQTPAYNVPASTLGATPFGNNAITPTQWTLWSKISGSMINSNDPRYGWVGFYSRDQSPGNGVPPVAVPNSYINVIAIITENQNPATTGYTPRNDLIQYKTIPTLPTAAVLQPATLQGWPVLVQIVDSTYGTTGMSQDMAYVEDYTGFAGGSEALANGAFIIISQDNAFTGLPNAGHFDGKIFRVGNRRTDMEPVGGGYQAWELQPGYDYTPDNTAPTLTIPDGIATAGAGKYAYGFVVGRGLINGAYHLGSVIPAGAAGAGEINQFAGNNQAIAAYTFTVPVQ